MTTIPHPPALQLAARIGRDATLLQVSIIGLASDLDNSAFFTKNLKPLIKNLKPRERLHILVNQHIPCPPPSTVVWRWLLFILLAGEKILRRK